MPILHLLLYKTPGQSQAIAALGPRSTGERGLRLAEEHRRRRRNHPLRWTPQDAVRFLQVEAMERACLVIRRARHGRAGASRVRGLTDRGSEYCGNPERHEYELSLAIEDIDHSRT